MTARRQYHLIGQVGQGGFGTVYQAQLVAPGGFVKLVAIKLLNADASAVPEMVRRLRDEARMLGLVRHQGIVQVDGLLQMQGRWGVVMEYVEGLDLHTVLRRLPIPPRCALEVIGQIASALDTAWSGSSQDGVPLRLIHRDIKPSNIRISSAGEVKLLDFGIARAEFAAREAITGQRAFGTLPYMAPERLEYSDGPAGDVYSLGVVLFECLARRQLYREAPYTRRDLHQDRVTQAQELAWRATDQRSEELIYFLGDLLAFDPEARPSVDEVARRCELLTDQLTGSRLRAWARADLRPVVEVIGQPSADSLAGAVLVEEEGASGSSQGAVQVERLGAGGRRDERPAPPSTPKPAGAEPRGSSMALLGLLLFAGFTIIALLALLVTLLLVLLLRGRPADALVTGRSELAEPAVASLGPPAEPASDAPGAASAAAPEAAPVGGAAPEVETVAAPAEPSATAREVETVRGGATGSRPSTRSTRSASSTARTEATTTTAAPPVASPATSGGAAGSTETGAGFASCTPDRCVDLSLSPDLSGVSASVRLDKQDVALPTAVAPGTYYVQVFLRADKPVPLLVEARSPDHPVVIECKNRRCVQTR